MSRKLLFVIQMWFAILYIELCIYLRKLGLEYPWNMSLLLQLVLGQTEKFWLEVWAKLVICLLINSLQHRIFSWIKKSNLKNIHSLHSFVKSIQLNNRKAGFWGLDIFLQTGTIRDHSFKMSANFHDFWPLPPTIAIPAKCLWRGFLILVYCDLLTISIWGHPSPPKTC